MQPCRYGHYYLCDRLAEDGDDVTSIDGASPRGPIQSHACLQALGSQDDTSRGQEGLLTTQSYHVTAVFMHKLLGDRLLHDPLHL